MNANYHTPQSRSLSSALTGTSSQAEEELGNSPSKIEGVGGSMNHPKNQSRFKELRRELRNSSTKAEKSLWNLLKRDQIQGLRFRRQYSIDNFILDFYCPKLKLCIELDGDYHFHVNQPFNDATRDEILLKKYGIFTLRFENFKVFTQPQTIVNEILNFKEGRRDHWKTASTSFVEHYHTPQSPSLSSALTGTSSFSDNELHLTNAKTSFAAGFGLHRWSQAEEELGNSPSKIEGAGGV